MLFNHAALWVERMYALNIFLTAVLMYVLQAAAVAFVQIIV